MVYAYLITNDRTKVSFSFSLSSAAKADPLAALDLIVANLDNVIAADFPDEASRNETKATFLRLDEKRKVGIALDANDKATIKSFYDHNAKYKWHRGVQLGKMGNVQYTTETYAPLPNEAPKGQFTNAVSIGRYASDKPLKYDVDSLFANHEGMTSAYNHDDAFAHCHTRKDVVKKAIKNILNEMTYKPKPAAARK